MIAAALSAAVWIGCSSDGADIDQNRGPIGKADLVGSCENACGGPSDGNCWCDDLCAEIGDCCSDAAEQCELDECVDDASCGDGQDCAPGVCLTNCQPSDPGCCAPATCQAKFCGGIANIQCPDGFHCELDGDFPDAGGHCEQDVDCQPVLCELFCEDGFQTDENGCEICVCNEPAVACEDLGGTCKSSPTDVTFPADCEGDFGEVTLPEGECAAFNQVCCAPQGEQCGNSVCAPGTNCCNPLTGACVLPGMVCAF